MSNSYENFQTKFIDEALDNIADLEQALMALELSPNAKELVERVFRSLHSLKGGGAMFGFDRLSEFTHRMENIYEMIRSGQLCVSSELLAVTLQSVDLLRDLLEEPGEVGHQLKQRCKSMEKAIDAVVREETEKMLLTVARHSGNEKEEQDTPNGVATYFIHFYPQADILENGTNLLYLLDDLKELGQMVPMPGVQSVPVLQNLNPVSSYVFWDIFLATDKGINEIKDVFIFVENEAVLEIHKISNSDLFGSEQFISKMSELSERQKKVDLSEIVSIASNYEESITEVNSQLHEANADEKSSSSVSQKHDKDNSCTAGNNGNGKRRTSSSIRVSTDKIDNLMNLVSEMVISQERLNMIASQHHIPELKIVSETVQKLTSQLRDSTFSISLIPIETLLTRFQRLVHDVSNDVGKKIDLKAEGLDTELDKTMIESLTDPLLHILRNSIDHGIETPDKRRKEGKHEIGTIHLKAFYSGANVIIEISDDGAGIDPEKVKAKAIEKGIIPEDMELSRQDMLNMVFRSGFSTNEKITELSGRGVGMDVVMRNIQAVRGKVNIDSHKGKGTTVSITLPLVLSIIDGLLVKIDQTEYVIPLSLTDRIFPVKASEIEKSFNNIISLGGNQMSFFDLRKELKAGGKAPEKMQMIVINYNEVKIALAVDFVIGKIQAVLKPLGKLYHSQKLISAATIMGDGSIALVLDTNAIVEECTAVRF
ncbi:chemotaxis protein CheA [Marinilabilia rubra]|uniref:Chemotaxis protein CheA n=1 Tax=Marinilabilia rubra TaxID=2162893 RepID=A0A2U2BC78_9BACT|nr:chemotaxis protein CheA [Marinilabilia rubra]PWE00674.1 chemotaxis protein CheA [Marinilabilia rubra]